MPELPDITLFLDALQQRIIGRPLLAIRLRAPFLLRTFEPPLNAATGRKVTQLRRLGKRIAIELEGDLWLVLHLMVAGRLHWRPSGTKLSGKQKLAAFDFESGSLVLTEAGAKRRAALYLVQGEQSLAEHDPGGIDVLSATAADFAAALRRENHTLKRALTDPHLFSGIGNAYSDEILHRAKLSPLTRSRSLTSDETARLHSAVRDVLQEWIDLLRKQTGDKFPEKVTAFRPEMAVHGKFGKPCPVCGTPIQRIRYAENETNYCPRCQTGGQIYADRSLSRLLKDDWPRTIQ